MTGFGRDHYRSGVSKADSSGRVSVIYIRKTGSDKHEGVSQNRAVRTFKRACELLPVKSSSGIVLDVGDGLWSEDITIPAVQFYGDSRFSRNISTRIGLKGKSSSHLGLVIRGAPGHIKGGVGFSMPHNKQRFKPTPFMGDFDANSNDVFYPSTRLSGTIFCPPGSMLETNCLSFVGNMGIFASSALVSIRACVFKSLGINCECHSDCWIESSIFFGDLAVKLKVFSSGRISTSFILHKNVIDKDESSILYIGGSMVYTDELADKK